MKRLSKLIAVVAAMALLMSMSMSVFAAENPSVEVYGGAYFENGEDVLVQGIEDPDAILGDDEEEMEANLPEFLESTFEGEVEVPEGATINVIGAWDITSEDKTVVFSIDSSVAGEGDYVYVLHYLGDGQWELMHDLQVKDGLLEVTFENGFSPVYLFVVEDKDGKVTALKVTEPEAEVQKDKPAAKGKSYNTGY